MSEVAELIKALVAASCEFEPIEKDRVNPFLKSKYATLDSVLKSVEPALLRHGLKLVQAVDIHESGAPVLKTTLYHESGQSISSSYPLILNDDPQKFGAAITYARRYSVCAALNITADQDDDAQSAKPATKAGSSTPAVLPVSGKRQQAMSDVDAELKRLAWSAGDGKAYLQEQFGKSTRKELTDDELGAFLSDLKNIEVSA